MKKIALSMLAVMLLMILVCGSAFALVGDMTTRSVKAYADPGMTDYVGTIPKFTSVMVRAYGSYADVLYNGVECFVKPSALTCGVYDFNYIGTATLKAGSNVYQRPSVASSSITTAKSHRVLVYAATNGYAVIRTGSKGAFGFVSTNNLTNLKAY